MAMSYTTKSRGSSLSYSTTGTASTSYTAYTLVTSITPPMPERPAVDDTDMDSPNDTNAYQPGYSNPGKVPVKFKFNDTLFTTLDTQYHGGTTLQFKIALPLRGTQTTASKIEFVGFWNKMGLQEINTDDTNKLAVESEITLVGKPTYTAGG